MTGERTVTEAERIGEIVNSIPTAAVATDRHNTVLTFNHEFTDLMRHERDGRNPIQGTNLFAFLQARDIFGNLLGREAEGLHEMVQHFDQVKDFKMGVTTGNGDHLFVGTSIVVVLGADLVDYHLIYLMTPILRRRRSDQLLDQILVGVGKGGSGSYVGEEARGMAEVYRLTARQKEVLRLLSEGKNSVEISEDLNLSIHTVRSHIQKILRVLEVNSQLEAVTKALTLRIL